MGYYNGKKVLSVVATKYLNPNGNIKLTQNGSYDVSAYKKAVVSVFPSGSIQRVDEEEVGLTTSQLPATTLPKGLINYVGGMSQKVNQLIENTYKTASYTATETTANYDRGVFSNLNMPLVAGHRVLALANIERTISTNDMISVLIWGENLTAITPLVLSNGSSNGYAYQIASIPSGVDHIEQISFNNYDGKRGYDAGDTMSYDNLCLVDLTDIYGAGNEPTTTSDARIKWLIHRLTENPSYDEGSIVNAPVEKLSSKGFNIWDEEWELRAGTYLTNKNHIKVTPNAQYFFHIGFYSTQQQVLRVMALDDEYNFIDYVGNAMNPSGWGYPNTAITMPPNASYIDFELYSDYGTTYNHDICINLSGTMNGTYLPYQAPSEYPIPAEVQALDGYGLGIDDTLYNYIDFERKKFVKKVVIVDLGTLNWFYSTINGVPAFAASLPYSKGSGVGICSKYALQDGYQTTDKTFMLSRGDDLAIWLIDSDYTDVNTFIASLSGTHLVYDIATTTETDISEFLDRDFPNENLIDTYQGGEVEFENDNDMGVPYSLTYQYKVE